MWRRKVITVFISPGPRQHFCFSTPSENAHAFSCFYRSLNNSVWFRFD